jgi:hypothetical protein
VCTIIILTYISTSILLTNNRTILHTMVDHSTTVAYLVAVKRDIIILNTVPQ